MNKQRWEQLKEWLESESERHKQGYRETGDKNGIVISSAFNHVLSTMLIIEQKNEPKSSCCSVHSGSTDECKD